MRSSNFDNLSPDEVELSVHHPSHVLVRLIIQVFQELFPIEYRDFILVALDALPPAVMDAAFLKVTEGIATLRERAHSFNRLDLFTFGNLAALFAICWNGESSAHFVEQVSQPSFPTVTTALFAALIVTAALIAEQLLPLLPAVFTAEWHATSLTETIEQCLGRGLAMRIAESIALELRQAIGELRIVVAVCAMDVRKKPLSLLVVTEFVLWMDPEKRRGLCDFFPVSVSPMDQKRWKMLLVESPPVSERTVVDGCE
jgi:hypothetical protein